MSVKAAPYFWLVCDKCGIKSTDGGDHSAWSDVNGALEDAVGGDWLITDEGRHYCDECRGYLE